MNFLYLFGDRFPSLFSVIVLLQEALGENRSMNFNRAATVENHLYHFANLRVLDLSAEMFLVLGAKHFGMERFPVPQPNPLGYSNTEELGRVLYTEYYYPFEIAAVILLVAIVAAIALTLRKRPETKFQDPALQIQVRKEDRLRIVKMDAEDGS